jgi:hypothetical protein
MKDYSQVQWLLANYGDPFVAHRDYHGRNCVSLAATEGALDFVEIACETWSKHTQHGHKGKNPIDGSSALGAR